MMSFATEVGPDTVILRIGPALDFRSAAEFRTHCNDLIDRGFRNFVLDLSATGILDSMGLGATFGLQRQVGAKNGRVLFAEPTRSVAAVIDLTRSYKVFGKYMTVEDALADLNDTPAEAP
ncbi:MAG TPA: STAS domain-containing protein [Rhodothermales bacterium]|nr:STAS domain-containing protein [Rhodothermales bacterium]